MSKQTILEIKNLSAGVEGKQILKGVNLTVAAGEVHAVMGPNGSGKSTLAAVLAGRDGYDVTGGEVLYDGHDLLDLDPEERAREGLFLAFQYPVEIPGVNSTYFPEGRAQRNPQGQRRAGTGRDGISDARQGK
jgi:Fe-S cluster assembly ATP-binding protein